MFKKIFGFLFGVSACGGILGLINHWIKGTKKVDLNDYRDYREIEPRH